MVVLQQLTLASKLAVTAARVKRGCETILTVAAVAAPLVSRNFWADAL